jgi:hypothetical protein
MTDISNSDNVIDTREIIERISEIDNADCHDPELAAGEGCDSVDDCPTCYGEAGEELAALRGIENAGITDFDSGATLIRDLSWPASYIDWDAAADALRMDYTSVDYAGVTYWVR